ncbi:peptidoglycan-binding domain-containing protein [Ruegeria marina]|uniref:Putative peptidoglycan binding domain-containing protein n=1 Tax=Ruegeria marina TaxID=639004 RepID=A0A1G6VC84_9RHOB|nr:peptidoglycan-binding domain-containing protein [Ruegeria marina]SDD51259.1 Putative peptidoglycan binding domain-containing protein [Ruegeria marina]
MKQTRICATVVAASLVVVPVQRAMADEAAALIGGALLGGLIVNEVHKNKQRQQQAARSTARSSGSSSAQRQENREVQSALNYFGYNAGVVDGALGRRSRGAIAQYQADMGFVSDGYLDQHELGFLLTSHQRALASGHVAPYNQILASQGQAGLLRTYRNEQLGIQTPQSVQSVQPQTQMALAAQPQVSGQGTVTARADTGAALPNFGFAENGPKSVNAHCNEVNLLTTSNGGPSRPGQIREPVFALNEQFCQARSQAMIEASQIEVTIPNLTAVQIEQQCAGLTQAMAPQMVGIETKAPSEVVASTSEFLQNSGQPMPSLISGGKVCLGVGYRTDDAEMALASATLLASAGQLGYGEMVSHQLRQGFGAPIGMARAGEWMRLALNAAQSGSGVLGQTPERIAVLTQASSAPAVPGLPVFSASTSGN